MQRITGRGYITQLSYLGDTEGCGYLRVIYPSILLNQYRHENFKFGAFFLASAVLDHNFYKDVSFIQFQRSATKKQLEVIKFMKNIVTLKHNVPIYYEIDDLLFGIESWNYAHEYYQGKEDVIKNIMSTVNGVVVSTPKLAEIYSEYNKNIAVNLNRLSKCFWGEPEFKVNESKKTRVLWAGSANHFAVKPLVERGIVGGDFSSVLIDYIKKTTDIYQWVFVGACPHELDDTKDKIEVHKWVPINEYPAFLKGLKIDIGIAPLQKNLFNQCKSAIKGLEYSAAGFPGIYTNIDPYEKFSMTCDTDEQMIENLEKMVSSVDLRKEVYYNDLKIVRPRLFWEENDNLLKYVNVYLSLVGKVIE